MKSLGNFAKRAKAIAHLMSLQPDVIFLLKTHAKRKVQSILCANWLGQDCKANFGAKARGVAILFRKNIYFCHNKVIPNPEGRYLTVVGVLNSIPVSLVNMYGPNI